MRTIGIVGGVASGKSLVARAFERRGAVVLRADEVGHDVLRDPEVVALVRDRWGEAALDAAGAIDRGAVGRIVFAPGREADRQWLNEQTHPRIRRRLLEQRTAAQAAGAPAAIVDAALLFESGWDRLCDAVVYVDTPAEKRAAHAAGRGWNADELARREATQWPLEEKRRRATHVLVNVGSADDLLAAADALAAALLGD